MAADNRFLEGSFAPVTEEITAYNLPVTGQIPAELTGRYLRNGPNPLGLDDPNYHWFLGAGMGPSVRSVPLGGLGVMGVVVSPRRGALLGIRPASRTASPSDPRPGPSPR